MKTAPVVSVLLTAYNREAFIGEAIESVLASSFREIELIIVDDASTDGTVKVASRYLDDSRVRIAVNGTNLGDYGNRNHAAVLASGEYIKYVDSDDFIYPHGLEAMVKCMQPFPEAALGLSALPDITGPYPRCLSPIEAYRENFGGKEILTRAPGSTIIRRAAFLEVGGFSGKRQVGDHELWLKLARRFPIVKMPTDLVWDRQHDEQERRFDSEVDRAVMHDAVRVEALMAEDCPLTCAERDEALRSLELARARYFWLLFRRGAGLNDSYRYRRRLGIPVKTILRVGVRAINPRSGPGRDRRGIQFD
jgi:glycosyltransferase involved in cell wall biosynthesis